MDVLLINPQNIKSQSFGITPPLGLAYMGCELERQGLSVKILDMELLPTGFDLFSYIKNLSPRIVGISGTSHSRFESFRISRITKQVSDKIFTVYGGCHATFAAEDTLSQIKEIDYIVYGEGEKTFPELVKCLLLKEGPCEGVAGVYYRRNGSAVRNIPRERISNLDSLSYSRHLLEMNKYDIKLDYLDAPATTIMTARGCPYACSFCSASAMFGRTYTKRSARHIVDEIEYCMQEFGIKGVRFFDSTFTLDRGHVLSLITELKARKIKLPWQCEIRIDTVDKDFLKAMKEGGCYYVDFGVESASENVLKKINKKINLRQVKNVLKWCKEYDIRTTAFFSFGHIGEAWQDSQQTIAFIDEYFRYMGNASTIFGIRIYPGTYVEQYARENELLPKSFSWQAPFENLEGGNITTDNVPILLQPNYGLKELEKCFWEIERVRAKKHLALNNILFKMRNLKSLSDLKQKAATTLKLIIKALLGHRLAR